MPSYSLAIAFAPIHSPGRGVAQSCLSSLALTASCMLRTYVAFTKMEKDSTGTPCRSRLHLHGIVIN